MKVTIRTRSNNIYNADISIEETDPVEAAVNWRARLLNAADTDIIQIGPALVMRREIEAIIFGSGWNKT